jgi:acetyl-CoA carboxylase carboxyltransferase component
MDTIDFTNRIEIEEQQELETEEQRMDEEDHGFDDISLEEEKTIIPSNPVIEYEPQDELDRVTNQESYLQFKNGFQPDYEENYE